MINTVTRLCYTSDKHKTQNITRVHIAACRAGLAVSASLWALQINTGVTDLVPYWKGLVVILPIMYDVMPPFTVS